MTNCCESSIFCAKTKKCVLIIGYISLVFYILALILGITMLVQAASAQKSKSGDVTTGIFLLVAAILNLFLAGLLILGAHKGNTRHLNLYVIITCILLILWSVALVTNPLSSLGIIPEFVFKSYCMIVVWRYRKEIESEGNQ